MKVLLYQQIPLVAYRFPIFSELATLCELIHVGPQKANQEGFSISKIDGTSIKRQYFLKEKQFFNGSIRYQSNVLSVLRKENPDVVLSFSGHRYISYWILLLYCWIRKKRIVLHTQGPYKQKRSPVFRFMYKIDTIFSKKIICYTDHSKKSFSKVGINSSKLRVAKNSILNKYPICPQDKNYGKKGVLFLGRLREGSGLELLFESLLPIVERYNITLHVIGDGAKRDYYEKKYGQKDWTKFYGSIYSQERISQISEECILGCYPGNSGLSIVHYMSLGLPPITHDMISKHQGPEPSYIVNGENGFLFDYNNQLESLSKLFEKLFSNIDTIKDAANKAFYTYNSLITPSYAQQIFDILNEVYMED